MNSSCWVHGLDAVVCPPRDSRRHRKHGEMHIVLCVFIQLAKEFSQLSLGRTIRNPFFPWLPLTLLFVCP